MKRIITILLSLSFFVPHAAKMLAYVDCSFVMLSNSDPNFCDCNMIVTADMIPLTPDQPDKQKELSIKADWKYVTEKQFRFIQSLIAAGVTSVAIPDDRLPQQSLQSVFRPPQC